MAKRLSFLAVSVSHLRELTDQCGVLGRYDVCNFVLIEFAKRLNDKIFYPIAEGFKTYCFELILLDFMP